jgi:hypothetical protein
MNDILILLKVGVQIFFEQTDAISTEIPYNLRKFQRENVYHRKVQDTGVSVALKMS